MKSLHKVNPNASHETWNPPDMGIEPPVNSQSDFNKEQVLAIFKNKEDSVLPAKKTDKAFTSWQPGLLSEQPQIINKYEWSFIEVSDSPFNKSWKPQASNLSPEQEEKKQEDLISENEISMILERARLQAEEIILAAQAEADEVLFQAQSEIEEQKKVGYQQGWNEAHVELEDTVKAARKIVEEIETWKTEFISGSEQIMVGMLKDISRKMFGDGVKLDAQNLHANLNRIMENARGLGVLKIFLNPNDARQLDPSWGEQQMLVLGEQVKIVPSSNIMPGGCLIKGNIGTVDGRVETQLNAILKTFDGPEEPSAE